ncbi:MAG: radical SAM protein [Litorimonas sp.]
MNTKKDGETVTKVPEFSILHDANAFSLDRRNFDILEDDMAKLWRADFLKCRRKQRPLPDRLIIEILNSCNLDCPMCRVGQHGVDLKRRMELDAFCTVLDQCESVTSVRLNGLGESTLVPNFANYIEELHRRSIEVELITNGTATGETYQRILENGGKVFFSWDAASPELFESLRRPASWNSCLDALKQACTYKTSSGNGEVGLLFTLQKSNITEFAPVVELAADFGADSVQLNVMKGGSLRWIDSEFSEIAAQISMASVLESDGKISVLVPDQINGRKIDGDVQITSGTFCSVPNREAVIRWNGDVQVCNMFNPYITGNAFGQDLKDSWESVFAQVFLKNLNTSACHPYCKNCAYMPKAYD